MGAIERPPFEDRRRRAATPCLGPEFAPFQDEPPQMQSGAVGKRGFLRLGFERARDGTILADLESRAPYLAQRALHCDAAMPDLAWLFLITTTGCVLQGDRLALDVTLGPGARAHVTTQSATKVHAMDANYALADADRSRSMTAPISNSCPTPCSCIAARGSRARRGSPSRRPRRSSTRRSCSRGASTTIRTRASASPCCRFGSTAARPDGRLLMSERLVSSRRRARCGRRA